MYEKDKLIVRDIPIGTEEEFFTVFVERCTGVDDGDGLSIDYRDTCAMIIFDEQYSDDGKVHSV